MAGGVSSPVIISVTIGAVLVLSVVLITIVRWARTKPSTQLPPPRPAFLSPYNQHRQSTYMGRGVPSIYDEERKLTAHGSGIFKPFGEYATSNASDSSLYRGNKAPYTDDGGDRTPNSGVSFGHEPNNNGGTMQQSYTESPQLQPNLELGEISLNSPQPPRQRPASVQFVHGTSTVRPVSSFGSLGENGLPLATAGGQAAATVPQSSSSSLSHLPPGAAPPSAFSHHQQPPPPRPFSNSARSRHSIAGPPVQQPPPSFNQLKQDRRSSRMSMLSTYSSHTFSYDHRRSSVGSMIRGPPHKSNMQIILPQPLAPTAAGNLPGSNASMYSDAAAEDAAMRRNQRRHSRVDMWTETNNFARARSPMADFGADGSRGRNQRPSIGSEQSGRSLELPNGGQRMQPPPPLPAAASSRSLLTSSPTATPNSSSSALPPMSSSSAMTTPIRSMPGSSEMVLEKRPGSSDAQSTSTLNNNNNAAAAATVDDSKPPTPQPQPQNDVKPDNLPIIPSIDTK